MSHKFAAMRACLTVTLPLGKLTLCSQCIVGCVVIMAPQLRRKGNPFLAIFCCSLCTHGSLYNNEHPCCLLQSSFNCCCCTREPSYFPRLVLLWTKAFLSPLPLCFQQAHLTLLLSLGTVVRQGMTLGFLPFQCPSLWCSVPSHPEQPAWS